MSEETQQVWIAGFWRRVGALLVDTLLLGIVGFVLGLALERVFVQMGGYGRFIGFAIALVYFTTMNSRLFAGQTLGKKLLKLRVVNADNENISLARSALRYLVIATPFSLNGAHFTNEAMLSVLIYPLSLIIFGGIFSILYLYIFNRVTRQTLHDLAVGTYVVNADAAKQEPGKVWNIHLLIVAVLLLTAAVVPFFIGKLVQTEPFKEMLAVQTAISSEPGVAYATITTSTTTVSSASQGTSKSSQVRAQVFLTTDKVGDSELARRIASIVLENYPEAGNKDSLLVVLTYGYDIGIWSQWSYHGHNFVPGEL